MSLDSQARRRERLEQIAEEFTEEISESHAQAELDGDRPVAPFAVVTSEGSMGGQFKNGTLFTCATPVELADYLTTAAENGQASYGRIWDLRTMDFDPGGNITAHLDVQLRGENGILAGLSEPDWLDALDAVDVNALASRVIREDKIPALSLVELMRETGIEEDDWRLDRA